MQGYNPQGNLPVPCNQVDQRFFNNNLPDGNDAIPQVQLSQWMQQNQQVGLKAIGLFRGMAQGACQKTPLHTFAYNLLCSNGFQNQVYQQWCQTVVDFTEFLVNVKGYQMPPPPGYQSNGQDAAMVAAQKVLEAFLGVAFGTYPALQQVTPQQMIPALQQSQVMYNSINNDINAYKSGHYNRPQPQQQYQTNGYNHGNLPQIQVGQGGQNYSHAQVGGHANVSSGYNSQPQHHSPAAPASGEVANSLYDIPSQQPLVPKEEISNEQPYNNAYYTEPAPMQQATQAQPVPEATNLPIPTNINEVVVDPTYYQPTGFKLDINRAYDLIHNPGGIEIRPAQLVDWEITPGDDAPWPQLIDPQRYCLFLVKFPGGVVKEKFVEWTDAMQYLRHELDAELRRKAYRPNGIVVSSATPISTIGGDSVKATEVKSLVEDGHLKASAVPPVVLDDIFQGANDLEVEHSVREELSNLLQTNFSDDVPMPAVEYRSAFIQPIQLTQTAFDVIGELRQTKNLSQVAQGLRDLTTQGEVSIRVMRVLNERLAKAVNDVMRDGLGLTLEIDDFCEDYLHLEDHLEQKRGPQIRKKLQDAAEVVLNRALTVTVLYEEDDTSNASYGVVDNFYNHQVGWDLADIASLNLKSGKAVLISQLAHPVILETLKGMIRRANEGKDTFTGILRLITRDGYYLELVKGRLIEGAHLLKLVK